MKCLDGDILLTNTYLQVPPIRINNAFENVFHHPKPTNIILSEIQLIEYPMYHKKKIVSAYCRHLFYMSYTIYQQYYV